MIKDNALALTPSVPEPVSRPRMDPCTRGRPGGLLYNGRVRVAGGRAVWGKAPSPALTQHPLLMCYNGEVSPRMVIQTESFFSITNTLQVFTLLVSSR